MTEKENTNSKTGEKKKTDTPTRHASNSANNLNQARQQIDSIDAQITVLLAQRMHLARQTRAEKLANGKSVEDAAREKAVLEHVETGNKGLALGGGHVARQDPHRRGFSRSVRTEKT
jgi:chorismate mutase